MDNNKKPSEPSEAERWAETISFPCKHLQMRVPKELV